uniref:Uncharacterized protein n=1 Tax=Caenorhabditis japonica TaxID=281687 RepID=A0A8R1HV00_CAEJA
MAVQWITAFQDFRSSAINDREVLSCLPSEIGDLPTGRFSALEFLSFLHQHRPSAIVSEYALIVRPIQALFLDDEQGMSNTNRRRDSGKPID